MEKYKPRLFNYLVIGLFFISLFTEIYQGEEGEIIGVEWLILGGLIIYFGKYYAFAAWLSILFFFCSFLVKKDKLVLKSILSGITILLGLLTLTVTELPVKAGTHFIQVQIGTGFYFLITIYILVFLKNLKLYKKKEYSKK